MRPQYIDSLGWAMAEVYEGVTDRILLNLAKHFKYMTATNLPRSSFEYQTRMLAQLGNINKQTRDIILKNLGGADAVLRASLEKAVMDALKDSEPSLQQAAKQGLLAKTPPTPTLAPSQMQAFRSYYMQSADGLNLVNTVMLESTTAAYQATVSDIVSKVQRTQTILNTSTGSVVVGADSWNSALRDAVSKMVDNGLTGFVDHAGRHWSPEAYVAMDIRSTMFNTARAAVWERAEEYGADIYQVSSHSGARPLCYPWQGKLISRSGWTGDVEDIDGVVAHVYAESETTKGEPAGLFGINCRHYPMTFIPKFSPLRYKGQDEEENDKTYEESQHQRALERKIRHEKLKLDVLEAQGATDEDLARQRGRVRQASSDIQAFCDETGRARHRDREYTPVNATFPPDGSYDPNTFPTTVKDSMNAWFGNTGDGAFMMEVEGTKYGSAVDAVPDRYKDKVVELIDDAPEAMRQAWASSQDRMKPPVWSADPDTGEAYYSPSTNECHFKSVEKAFERSSYQEENAVYFHEYGHCIDQLMGHVSSEYKNGAFGQALYRECGQRVREFYEQRKGTVDPIELLFEESGYGASYLRQLTIAKVGRSAWSRMRDEDDPGDDVSKWKAFLDQHAEIRAVAEEDGERILTRKLKDPAFGAEFCDFMKQNYDIYERSDVSDLFAEYAMSMWGEKYTHPFGVGHDEDYWKNTYWGQHGSLAAEAFAEMYSASVCQNKSLGLIKEMFPESYSTFLEMIGGGSK